MNKFIIALLMLMPLFADASILVEDESGNQKVVHRLICGSGMDCTLGSGKATFDSGGTASMTTITVTGQSTLSGDVVGDGGDQLVGFLNNQVAATATTITAAECGSSFINGGAVQMELPEASTVLGCRLTFITGDASNFDVNPDDADQILVETNAAGDAMRNATLGNSITIEAISATEWAPVSTIGTWTDID